MASTRVSTLNGSAPPTAGQLVRLACVDNDNHGASSTVIWLEFDARMLDDESSKSIDVTQSDERNSGALRKELFADEVARPGGDGCGGEGDREGRIRIVMGVRDSSGSPPPALPPEFCTSAMRVPNSPGWAWETLEYESETSLARANHQGTPRS